MTSHKDHKQSHRLTAEELAAQEGLKIEKDGARDEAAATRFAAKKTLEATETIEGTEGYDPADEAATAAAVQALETVVADLEDTIADEGGSTRLERKILREEEKALKAEKKAHERAADKEEPSLQDHAAIIAEEHSADAAGLADESKQIL